MGISTKCFEILENRPTNYDLRHDGVTDGPTGGMAGGYAPHDPLMSDDESEATEDEDEDDLDGGVGTAGDPEDSDSEVSDEVHDDSDDDSFLHDERKGPKLRVREIVSITPHLQDINADEISCTMRSESKSTGSGMGPSSRDA